VLEDTTLAPNAPRSGSTLNLEGKRFGTALNYLTHITPHKMKNALNLNNLNPEEYKGIGEVVMSAIGNMIALKEDKRSPHTQLRHELFTFELNTREAKKKWVRAEVQVYFDAIDFDRDDAIIGCVVSESRYNEINELTGSTGIKVVDVMQKYNLNLAACQEITNLLMEMNQKIATILTR